MKSRKHVVTNGRATFYACMWNDFRQAALDKGWALALHGSMASDMDIMAMAWTEDAKPIEEMISALESCLTEPDKDLWFPTKRFTDKPNNRVVYTICIFADLYQDKNVIEQNEKTDRQLIQKIMISVDKWLKSDETFVTDKAGNKITDGLIDCVKGSLLKRMIKVFKK